MRIRGVLVTAVSVLLAACGGGGVPSQSSLCEDTASDPLNCGVCGYICDVPVHAQVACFAGECGRTACDPGWADLDSQFGCESNAGPFALPESGVVFWAFPVGAYPTATQTPLELASPSYAIAGVMGEALVPELGTATLSSPSYELAPGFTAVQH